MKDYGAVINEAEVITTDSGNNLPWPTVDDTSNVGVILAENTQMAEQDATVGQASLDAYVISSKLTRVSFQLLQDSAVDPEALIVSLHGERIGRGMNVYLTTGTGTAQPDGIVTNAATGVTAAGAAAITADELIDLVHSVDPAYRNERAAFMLADATLAKVRKLKDSQNQYLWQPGLQAGQAGSLFGHRYVVNQQMPAATTGNKSVLFGDFREGYVVRIVRQIQNIRFSERYADYLQVGFTSFARFDGTQKNASAYKALVQA
jgi:HK97 family phage major capsid protein